MISNIPTVFTPFGSCLLDTEKTLEAVSMFYLHFGKDTVTATLFALNTFYADYAERGQEIPKDVENLLFAIAQFVRELYEAQLPLKSSSINQAA
jgi:hypothetical protein